MARTFVIGDIHGCVDELDRLLDRCALGSDDSVVSVGDLVNKGPDSLGVLRLCRKVGAKAVLGNHDDLLLRCIAARKEGDDDEFPELVRKIAKRIDEDDAAWLAALPLYLPLALSPELPIVVVHAGLLPAVPFASQERANLLNMRSIRSDGSPSKRIDEGVPWASLWVGPEQVIFGHDAVRGLQEWPYATGIDTACVYGGRLSAIEIDASQPGKRRIVSVPARREYCAPGRAVAANMDRKK
jgi:hypothetical protein